MKKLLIISIILLSGCFCKEYKYETHIVKNKWQNVDGYNGFTSTTYYISFENGEYQSFTMSEWGQYSIGDTITTKQCEKY